MSTSNAAESDDAEAGMDRLEAALERIATLSEAASARRPDSSGPDTSGIADRLDTMIRQLRAAIDES